MLIYEFTLILYPLATTKVRSFVRSYKVPRTFVPSKVAIIAD